MITDLRNTIKKFLVEDNHYEEENNYSTMKGRIDRLVLILLMLFGIIYIVGNSGVYKSRICFNEDLTDVIKKSKPIDAPDSYIKSTNPKPFEKGVEYNSPITITFNKDMDCRTLNGKNILILEGQHGDSIVSDMFTFNYVQKTRILNIVFKDVKSSFPQQDSITVILTNRICTSNHKSIGDNYIFGYSIK